VLCNENGFSPDPFRPIWVGMEDDLDLLIEDKPIAPQVKERRCLVCQDKFLSAWSGERVCKRCRQTSHWRSG